jgi:hypothetical protein
MNLVEEALAHLGCRAVRKKLDGCYFKIEIICLTDGF